MIHSSGRQNEVFGEFARGNESYPNQNRRPTLLVVDDDNSVLETSVWLLRQSGFNVVPESDPAEALKSIATVPDLDCLICDFQMPRITGVDLAYAAKKLRPTMPVLILSGIHPPESESGPWDAWVLKGLPISELVERIEGLRQETL